MKPGDKYSYNSCRDLTEEDEEGIGFLITHLMTNLIRKKIQN